MELLISTLITLVPFSYGKFVWVSERSERVESLGQISFHLWITRGKKVGIILRMLVHSVRPHLMSQYNK